VNGLFVGLRTDSEQKIREVQERIEELRSNSITDRNNQLKAMDEERGAFKKAHDEHMRCLNMERDARMRESAEIRADFAKTFADNRKVHVESQNQVESLIALERQARQDLLEAEQAARIHELQELKIVLSRQFTDAHNAEKAVRAAELEKLLGSVTSTKTEIGEKLNQMDAMYAELRSSYQKLVTSHTQLLSAHNGLSTSHSDISQSCETQRADFNSSIESERNARTSALTAMEDAHRAELGNLYNSIQSLEVFISEDRARAMEQHTETKSCADTKHNELKQCIEERLAMLEAKFNVLEPQWSADFNTLKEEVSSITTTQATMTEEQRSFEQSFRATQNEVCGMVHGAQAAASENKKIILEESAQRCTSTQELKDHIKDISQTVMKLDSMKDEIISEYKSHLGEFYASFELRYEAATMSQQLESMESKNEKLLHELETRLEEIHANFMSERNLHLKWMEEERAAFKKSHEEHMRCVEVERNARVRQTAELRTEFVKLITKEREDRIVDASVRRSEVDRAKQSIKAMNIGLGGSIALDRSTLLVQSTEL